MTAGRDGAAGWILAAALLLASPLPGLPAAQAQPGPDAHALPTAPATALPGNGTLASLARWIGLPALDGAAAVRSPLLGITLPAAGLAQAYQAKAAASPTPLRDAVLAWNQALALQPAAALVADPRLEDAASLPLPAQRAAATMLYALADATLLQREAVSHLTVGQYRALLAAPAAAVAGRFDPSVPDAAAALAALRPAAAAVDGAAIQAATAVVAAAAQDALPALRAWSQEPAAQPTPAEAALRDLLAHDAPEAVAALDPIERIRVAEDALRLAATVAGLPMLATPAPAPLDARHPLAGAIAGLLAATGASWTDGASSLAAADRLPVPLQQALGRVVAASATLQRTLSAAGGLAPQDAAVAALSAQLGVLGAARSAAPTLEAWGLVWGHMGQGLLPATPAQAGQPLRLAQDLARLDGAGRLQALLAMARPGVPAGDPAWKVPAGSLDDALLALYGRAGIAVAAGVAQKVRQGVAALDPAVASAAAGILWAELGALGRLDSLYAGITPADRAALAAGIDLHPLLEGPVSLDRLQRMRALYARADEVQAAYLDGAAGIAAAVAAAAASLEPARQGQAPVAPVPAQHKGFLDNLGDLLGSFHPFGVVVAQSSPLPPVPPQHRDCPDSPLADCKHDIWFMDPLLATVVITGTEQTTYDPATLVAQFPGIVPNPPRGQVLSLDLGGADTYANNAGGAILAFAPDPIGNPVQLDGVAVAVDLGGDDAYQLPAAGGHDAIQGAGMGGIGILYDQGGRDTFEADQRAQGYASSAPACGAEPCGGLFGVGLLVHGDGTATYDALNRAQGAAEGASHDAVCQDLSCLPQGGMETPVLPGGLGALLEGDGTTTYNLPGARAPHLGQAGADAGLAFLLDAGGNDHYNFGLQGQATRAGVGLLVDLGGQDAYTRQPAEQFADDHCWASLRAPQGDPLRTDGSAPPGFVDNVTAAAEQRTLGVFVDVTLPGIPPGVPSGQACYDPQQLQPPQPDPDPFKPDQPGDGWPEFVERLNPFGAGPWDAGNDTDYPAGLPHDALLCTQADALPPELAGLCAPGQGLPYGSSYLVRVPGVLAIGDAVQTVYPAATDATRGRDYAVAIDLGGGDRFFNRMGGGPGLARPDGALLASVALDVGDGNFYSSGEACVQGCNSLLLDLGANAFFQATRAGTPLDPTVAQGACLGKPGAAGLGLLFHAQGRATFRIEALGAGNLGQGAAATALGATSVAAASATKQATDAVQGGLGPCLGLLVDTGGDGAYRSPSQGAATGNGAGAGLFLDLGGRDVYVPAGRQGVGSGGSATLPEGGNVGIFVDQGLPADTRPDIYSGTVADLAFPDFSQTFNNRTVARATGIATPGTTGTGTTLRPPAAGLFWDQASASASGLGDPGAGAGLDLPGEGIRVGGKGADAYRRDYALLIDQGGDDRYDDNAGATLLRGPVAESDGTPPGQTAAVAARANPWDNFPVAAALIDLGGSDTFTAPDQPVVGAGAAGYGTLLSPAGGILSQGAGLLGVGLLVKDDGSTSPGTDHYRARGLAQGAAMLGSGILWKRTGSAVFSLEGDTVQAPAMDGGVVAWRQFVDGQWRLMAQAAAGRTCLVSPAGDSGPVGDLAVEGPRDGKPATTLVYSAYGAKLLGSGVAGTWSLRAVDLDLPTGDGACPTPAEVGAYKPVTAAASNQRQPAIGPDAIVWQDDRAGAPTLFRHPRAAAPSAADEAACQGALPACPPGPQSEPDVAGTTLVWTQSEGGGSTIYSMDLGSRATQRLAEPGHPSRQDAHPRIAEGGAGLAVWQTRNATAPAEGWDVVLDGLATLHPQTLALPGDQVDPATNGRATVFRDEDTHQLLCRACLPGVTAPLHEGGGQAALDRAVLGGMAWRVDGLPATPDERPAGTFSAEVLRGTLFAADGVPVSDLALHPSGAFLQGAAFLGGLGLLLDEAGDDRFVAGDHAQGSAFALDLTPAAGLPAEEAPSGGTPGAHGILVSSGNDRFFAQLFAQGAVLDVPATAFVPNGGRLPSAETVQASHALGLLLGQHGSNTYDANGAAQGFGALMAGFSQVPGEPDPMNPRAPPPPSGIAVTADGAAGVLADLGGVDVFTNVWVNRTWASLADPCGLVALDGVPGLEALLAQCRAAAAPAAADEPDSLWTQGAVRAGPTAACAGQTPLDPLAQMVLCNQQVAVVGGIGLDLSLLDRSDAVVAKAAGIDLKVKVGFQKEDPGHTPILSGVPVRGPVRFVASVEKTSPVPYEVQSVEFYVNGRFLDYGTPSGDQYVLPVDTATDATPDGTYRVAARVLVRGSTQLPSPGFVEGSSDLVVNNPPRILAPRVAPTSFSPFPTVPGAPALPDVSFGLTKGTPADPDDPDGYVLVQVFGPGGNLVGTLASPADGPAANPFHATWDGLVDGQAADPGLYRIQVQAADRRVQANTALDPDRLAAAPPLLVQVGSVGPTGGCVRVKVGEKDGTPILSGCNPQMAVTRAQATRDGGSPRLVLSLAADPGRDLGGARLFRSPSPAGAWTELELPAGSFGRALDVENGSFRLMVLAQDRDGNLECAPSCGGKVEAATPAEALAQALAAKEALGQFATFVVDLDPPEVLGVVNAKPLSLDGEAQAFSPADVAPRVGPNSVVRVAFAIHKAPTPGMQPPQGLLAWSSGAEGVDPTDGCYHPTVAVDGEPVPGHPGLFSVAWPPAGTADAAVAAWRAIVRAPGCPAWADGPVSLTVGARDEAGNLASNLAPDDASAWLTLVGKAPVVDVAASHVEYPDGRSYAQTGDEVTLVVKMAAPGALAFHESKLCAFLGANPLVPAPPATACGKDGLSCASSPGANVFCYDPQPTRKAFVATVPITVEDGLHAQPFSIPLTIADPVGNLAQFHLDVVVGAPDVGAGEGTALPRVGGADVLFATGRPSTARLHYGQDEKALDQWAEEVPDPAGLVHAFHLEGLTPGATYFYQLVASDSGAQEVSPAHLPLPRFRVLYGVDVQVTDPGDGAILSGSRLVHYHAGVQKPSAGHGDQPFVRITLVPHDTSLAVVDLFDDAPSEKPVKLATASPSSPDGLYDVVAQASYDGETVESRVTGLLLDNTPPTGALVEPAPDAILPAFPRTLLLRVSDAGSGVAPTLGLRVNGSAVPALARFVPDAVGAGGILEATLPLGLSLKGTIPVLATVADRAGTSTQVLARVLVDPEAPAVTSASILYPDGQTAGRPGQGARLLVRLSDGAGIAAASADLRAVGGSIRTQLQEGPLGHFVDFTLPATATDGAFPIPFQATNLAGLTAVGEAVARVDTQPPRLLSSEARPTGMDAAAFSLTASEPVRATVEVLSGASRVLRTPSSGLSETPTLPLTGLQAAHDYVLRVRLVDRAGNVATQDVAWRFAPLEATPAPVTGLAARPAAAGIRLTWDAQLPEAAFRYDVMRSDGGLFRRVASVASATFLDDGVAAGSPYQYFVQAANLHGSLGPASGVAQAVAGLGAVVEPTVSPSVGLAGQTDFLFRAQVRRALEARPLAWLVVDGTRYAMEGAGADCRDACAFTRTLRLPALDLKHPEVRFAVELLDGGQLLRLPEDGSLPGPEVLAPATAGHGKGLLGAPAAGALLLPLLLAAAVVGRRRRA